MLELVRLLNKQAGLINVKLTFTSYIVHGAWDGVTQELEEMDDSKTYFDSTNTVITTTLQLRITFMMTHTTTIT